MFAFLMHCIASLHYFIVDRTVRSDCKKAQDVAGLVVAMDGFVCLLGRFDFCQKE